jgi:polysaccharide biosynthesis/export protein
MISTRWLFLTVALTLGSAPLPVFSQVPARPSPAEAEQILRTRPEVVHQLRERLEASGLTPAQIRARLQAEGYPSSLLDAYLAGSDEEPSTLPGDEVFSAVRALGIIEAAELDTLRRAVSPRRITVAQIDSLLQRFADSLDIDVTVLSSQPDTLPRSIRELLQRRTELLRLERMARERVDSGYTIFGLDIFRRSTSEFDANLHGPVDPNYRLGPGDQLVLVLTGDVEAAYPLEVTREGFIVVPRAGQMHVANLTMAQLEELLFSRLGRIYSGVSRSPGANTRFSVSMSRLRSIQVYVVGDVTEPGSYRVSGAGTMMSALYAARGPTENGSFRNVELRRGGAVVGRFDIYDYLLQGNSANDLRLQTGDVVFVPPRVSRVRVWGEVVRPATYELRPGESLAALIRAAGGFTATADRRRVQIERISPAAEGVVAASGRVLMDVSAADGGGPLTADVPVQDGDVVRVLALTERATQRIAVTGSVWTPGPVGFRAGMRLSEALRQAGGLQPDAYLGQVLVTRLRPDSSRVQLRAAIADTTGRALDDIELADGDEIQVFSQSEFRPRRYVVVSGAVRRSGRYPYREGMTLRDLALMAGGLQESAMLDRAEVARLPENRAGGVTARAIHVPLDSSYLFERGPDGRYMGPPGLPGPPGRSPEVALLPYDNVLFFRQPDWELPRTVALTGEVRFPGRYTLTSKSERLVDLIDRAGGLTEEAYAGGIVFNRRDRGLGRIGLDLPAALRNPRHRDNLLLVDGDSVAIPVYSAIVNVRGAVNTPVAVAYVPGRTIDYYIDAAGGSTRSGDLGRAFVTQPSGKVESRRRTIRPRPEPGAVVFVPLQEQRDRRDTGAILALTAQVLASVFGMLAVIRTL